MTANPTNAPSRKSTDRWENEGGPMAPPKTRGRDDVPVTLTAFDRGGPRYAKAKDAIAAAKRPWRQA